MINPVALQIGPLPIRWYGIILVTAMLVGTFLASREAKRRGENAEHAWNILTYCVLFAILGARAYYVIFSWDQYQNNWGEIFAINHGGLAIHGGLIGGGIAFWIYCRFNKLNPIKWLDIAAPSLILGQAIGRWGNFINQEAFGTPTDLPWKIFIDREHRPAQYVDYEYFHPTFLYESLWDLGVFGILFFLSRKFGDKLKPGNIFLSYGLLYSIGRFLVEGLRTDSLMFGPIRQAQAFSLLIVIIFAGILIYRYLKSRLRPLSQK